MTTSLDPQTSAPWSMPIAANRSGLTADSDFMLSGWGDASRPQPEDNPAVAFTADRRERLAQALPDEVLVVPCGEHAGRSNDSYHVFRPGTDHVWLTGNREAASVLVVDTTGGVAGAVL